VSGLSPRSRRRGGFPPVWSAGPAALIGPSSVFGRTTCGAGRGTVWMAEIRGSYHGRRWPGRLRPFGLQSFLVGWGVGSYSKKSH